MIRIASLHVVTILAKATMLCVHYSSQFDCFSSHCKCGISPCEGRNDGNSNSIRNFSKSGIQSRSSMSEAILGRLLYLDRGASIEQVSVIPWQVNLDLTGVSLLNVYT